VINVLLIYSRVNADLHFFHLQVRIPVYAFRAALARDKNMGIKSPKFIQYGASVLLIAAYLFFVEGVMSLTLALIMEGRNIKLTRKKLYAFYGLEHLICLIISIFGVIGAILLTGAMTANDIKQSRILRALSGGLFAALIIFLMVLTIFHFTFYQTKNTKSKKANLQMTILFTLQFCALLEAIHRIWSAAKLQGFIVGSAAVPVLIFLPEALSILILLIIPLHSITTSSQDSITEEE
jgi:hypothetical protein